MARLANELVFGDEEGKTTTDDTVPAIRHTHNHNIHTHHALFHAGQAETTDRRTLLSWRTGLT